jgi:hypothetical protein
MHDCEGKVLNLDPVLAVRASSKSRKGIGIILYDTKPSKNNSQGGEIRTKCIFRRREVDERHTFVSDSPKLAVLSRIPSAEHL